VRGRWRFKSLTTCGCEEGGSSSNPGQKIDTKESARRQPRAKKAWTMREIGGWRIAKEVGAVPRSTHNKTRAIVHSLRIKTIKKKKKSPPHHPLPPIAE